MLKIFDVRTPYTCGQTYSVVAESMAEAEKLFLLKYPSTTINEIRLHSEYVTIKEAAEKDHQTETNTQCVPCSNCTGNNYNNYPNLNCPNLILW